MNAAFARGLFVVGLLTAEPVNNGNKSKDDANPVKRRANRIDDILKSPLKEIGYRRQNTLEIHG